MDNTEWLNNKIQIRDRFRIFTLKIPELSEMFPDSQRSRIINNQLPRSGSSTYANYRAALRGRSKNEFFAKLSISEEEADETVIWVDLVISSGIIKSDFIEDIHSESLQLLKILSSMRKKMADYYLLIFFNLINLKN